MVIGLIGFKCGGKATTQIVRLLMNVRHNLPRSMVKSIERLLSIHLRTSLSITRDCAVRRFKVMCIDFVNDNDAHRARTLLLQ